MAKPNISPSSVNRALVLAYLRDMVIQCMAQGPEMFETGIKAAKVLLENTPQNEEKVESFGEMPEWAQGDHDTQ